MTSLHSGERKVELVRILFNRTLLLAIVISSINPDYLWDLLDSFDRSQPSRQLSPLSTKLAFIMCKLFF